MPVPGAIPVVAVLPLQAIGGNVRINAQLISETLDWLDEYLGAVE